MGRAGYLLSGLGLLVLVGLIARATLRPADTPPLETGGGEAGTERPRPPRGAPALPRRPAEPARIPPPAGGEARPATPGALRGTVVGPGGGPAAGVEVYAAGADDVAVVRSDLGAWTRTAEDGSFELLAPPGTYDLVAFSPGLLPAIREGVELRPGAVREIGEIRLEEGLSVAGRVVDLAGRPVEEVLVVAYRDESLLSPALLPARLGLAAWGGRAVTDHAGDFRIGGLGRGPVRLRAGGRPDIVMAGEPLETVAGAEGLGLVVRRIRVATGRVVAEDGETGIGGATVTLAVRVPAGGGAQIFRTAPDGRFAFDLSDSRYGDERVRFDLLVSADGFEDAGLTGLAIGELLPKAKLVVRLVKAPPREPGRLRGRALYDTGRPFVGSFTLSFSREGGPGRVFRVVTDEEGAFLVEGIPAGEYLLRTAARRSRVLRETGRTLVIPPGGEEVADLTFPRGADLEVVVRGAAGEPVRGAQVHLLDEEGEVTESVPAGGGGATLLDLPPGPVRFRVTAPGFRDRTLSAALERERATRVEVRLGEGR